MNSDRLSWAHDPLSALSYAARKGSGAFFEQHLSCRRACAPLGSATHAIGGCRKRTYSTSPLLRRSISIGLWRGSTNDPGPQPVPHALPPSLLTTPLVEARQPPELLVFPPQRNPSRPECIRGLDHGVGHPLLFLCNSKVPNYRKNKAFKSLHDYFEWPKVADTVIEAVFRIRSILYYRNNFCSKYTGTAYRSISEKACDSAAPSAAFSLVAPTQSLY